jgi:hypothetical protein
MAISDSQKGRVIERLVGATLILQSDGALRVSLPLVDDEGVDLVVANRSYATTLLPQIKSRFSPNRCGHHRANVRRATCTPNPNTFLLFVYYHTTGAALSDTCWLVCVSHFCRLLRKQKASRPVYVFDSTVAGTGDTWAGFRRPDGKEAS